MWRGNCEDINGHMATHLVNENLTRTAKRTIVNNRTEETQSPSPPKLQNGWFDRLFFGKDRGRNRGATNKSRKQKHMGICHGNGHGQERGHGEHFTTADIQKTDE